jgi:hypothetical protein
VDRTYRAVNTLRLGYKNQSVNALQWNNHCLFWDPHKTHNYALRAVPSRLQRMNERALKTAQSVSCKRSGHQVAAGDTCRTLLLMIALGFCSFSFRTFFVICLSSSNFIFQPNRHYKCLRLGCDSLSNIGDKDIIIFRKVLLEMGSQQHSRKILTSRMLHDSDCVCMFSATLIINTHYLSAHDP